MGPNTFGSTSRTHIIVGSILAALQILNGGAALADFIGPTAFGLFALCVAAFQGGWQFYTAATSVPNGNVAAALDNKTGELVAGPASETPNNVQVEVVPVPVPGTPQEGM